LAAELAELDVLIPLGVGFFVFVPEQLRGHALFFTGLLPIEWVKKTPKCETALYFSGVSASQGVKLYGYESSLAKHKGFCQKNYKVRKLSTAPQRPYGLEDATPGLWITSIFKKASND
jgi:hypothetical protein